ncbi:SCO3242 family prenyltransferase [Streptomyces atroolivaceus]|uniref:SCO3242 family prenyltransferase n=1 Tax=Streptomyces atroolivaceus TaxID=66869 RepID=UPI0036C9A59D
MIGSPRLLGARPAAPPYSLSGAGGTAPAPDRPATRARLRAWAELLRVSALVTVPGDALAGAAAAGRRPGRGTALAVGASLCLYEAGMALNDWADREEDAVDRPHRPIPSGRVTPGAALAAAAVLTGAGLALASRAGRPALAVASGLAATVWAYDLRLKHTQLGPAAMATARTLDLMLGATATVATMSAQPGRGGAASPTRSATAPTRSATAPAPSAALPAALALGAHTYAVTAVSRHEVQGGSTAAPMAALAGVAGIGAAFLRVRPGTGEPHRAPAVRLLLPAFTAAYLHTSAVPLLHAALNPSPPLTQRAVGGGIRAMIPLQAALTARAGAPVDGLAVMGLVPLARALARKVSAT